MVWNPDLAIAAEPPQDAANRWSAELLALQEDYEAGLAYADRFVREFAAFVPAEGVRAYAMSSEEIAAVEAMGEAERIAWMCGADVDTLEPNAHGSDPSAGLYQPPLELGFEV